MMWSEPEAIVKDVWPGVCPGGLSKEHLAKHSIPEQEHLSRINATAVLPCRLAKGTRLSHVEVSETVMRQKAVVLEKV